MIPRCKVNDEDLETVAGGMIAGPEEISTPDGIVVSHPDLIPVVPPTPVI